MPETVPQIFLHQAKLIKPVLQHTFEQAVQWYPETQLSQELLPQLAEFATAGKLVRGSLLLHSWQLLANQSQQTQMSVSEPAQIAAAIELIHSGLLVHDDIIDQDQTRRNQPCIYLKFAQLSDGVHNPHQGTSLAISSGILLYFLATHLINQTRLPSHVVQSINQVIGQEISRTALAEMNDVYFGYQASAQPETILHIHAYKTGRYTFHLPFKLAFLLAGTDWDETNWSKLSHNLGIIYQLQDDLLNIFADPQVTGKSIGSDVKDNKKTLFRYFVGQHDPHQLELYFGKSDLTVDQLQQFAQTEAAGYARQKTQDTIQQYVKQSQSLIDQLQLPEKMTDFLHQLLLYLTNRDK